MISVLGFQSFSFPSYSYDNVSSLIPRMALCISFQSLDTVKHHHAWSLRGKAKIHVAHGNFSGLMNNKTLNIYPGLGLVGRSWNADPGKDWPESDPITGGSEADVLVGFPSVLLGRQAKCWRFW